MPTTVPATPLPIINIASQLFVGNALVAMLPGGASTVSVQRMYMQAKHTLYGGVHTVPYTLLFGVHPYKLQRAYFASCCLVQTGV